ncbi:hypothetical protein KORDIASMS9_03719 [Kordia sp. SMS9]|uniref:hypothetical protein n=1 Tax=Kordia sp. SMS9 TaxID=2282170 RepID=UPI000E0DE87D|nr:hypothetical protein [Kordia sp. SMS9]AXG71462.1 hypothetical protein KORDIASMS9_03719 [Kordia sp. SMS9]
MKSTKNIRRLLPTFGILIFIGVSFYAASLYPGGSQVDANAEGFDCFNNYWCNLMSEKGENGVENPARWVAIASMAFLCASMILFFFYFATTFEKNNLWKRTIKISGAVSMSAGALIFTTYHDVMTTILSVFGTLVIIALLRTLYKRNMMFYMVSGVVCIILIVLNNLFYYTESLLPYLPTTQKITFILILAWTIALNFKMIQNKMVVKY